MRVPLRLRKPKDQSAGSLEDERIRAGDVVGVLKEVNSTCFEYQREEVRRIICRVNKQLPRFSFMNNLFNLSQIAAQSFVENKDFGLAVSYCASAEDWPGLGRVVDRVLDEYIIDGLLAISFRMSVHGLIDNRTYPFRSLRRRHSSIITGPSCTARVAGRLRASPYVCRSLRGISAAMHAARCGRSGPGSCSYAARGYCAQSLVGSTTLRRSQIFTKYASIFSHRIQKLTNTHVTDPTLLFSYSGACQLLRRLEEIFIRAEQGSGSDYLGVLMRTMPDGGEKEALNRLQPVRLGLARYFARCTVIDVGGKHVLERRAVV